ncbi:CBS domain-containing protein, partial [bacterium]|nr:CBS domain-containing protein [bacterium]
MSSSSFFERLKETFRKPIDKAKRNQLAEEWIEEAERDGLIDEDDSELFHGVFDLSTRQVGEIMVPRTSVTAIPETTPIADVIETIQSSGHSRIPVYSETIDRIIGFVYAKDLLAYWGTTNGGFELRSVLREPLYTTEDKPVDDLLREMQKKKIHLAVVVDEYGTTSGLVSIEDIIELIVGDIHDEYDSALEEPSLIVQDGWVTAPGNMP